MSLRLRPNARAFTATALVVAAAALPPAFATAAGQAANPGSLDDLLGRVSRYVESYHARAQSLMVEETVTVQPIRGDLMPDGFARSLVYDLRFEWKPGERGEKSGGEMVRELVRANRRPPKPGDEPKCLDPAPVTPAPLEFLLRDHHKDYKFSDGGRTTLGGREARLLEFVSLESGSPRIVADPKGTGDMECAALEVPGRTRGRIWAHPETAAVLQIEETLIGPTTLPVPKELRGKPGWLSLLYVTLDRQRSSVRYSPVSFADPDETLMLPSTIEHVWVTIAGSISGVRMTQQYRNYRRFLTESRILPLP